MNTRRMLAGAFLASGIMCIGCADSITHGGTTINMGFVDIGHAGNAADTTGFGTVDHDYRIGRYEVTVSQWDAVRHADPNVGNTGVRDGNHPTTWVSWYEAAKFCNWLTSGSYDRGAYRFADPGTFQGVDRDAALSAFPTVYVLPTENEWYKAAYFKDDGSGYTLYPTGNSTPVMGTDANYGGFFTWQSTWTVDQGSAENNGTYNMGGNVWEWIESNSDGSPQNGSRWLRGGAYNDGAMFLDSAHRVGGFYVDNEYDNRTGFRVAAIPEPSSLTMIAVVGACVATVRRRLGL